MWTARVAQLLSAPGQHVFCAADDSTGVEFAFADLSRRSPRVVWLALDKHDAGDPVALGNRLAHAVNRALGETVLPGALPFSYGVQVLKQNMERFGPLLILVSKAGYGKALVDELLTFNPEHCKLVAAFKHLPTYEPLYPLLVLGRAALALSPGEALDEAAGRAEAAEVVTLWQTTSGRYTDFLVALSDHSGLPLPEVPTPAGTSLRPPGREVVVKTSDLFEVLKSQGRFSEAFELAVQDLPAKAYSVVSAAGPEYQNAGLLERLFLLLRSLDDSVLVADEHLLEWLLVAAGALGRHREVLALVQGHLERYDAPDLRARACTLLPPTERLLEAQRCVTLKRSSLSLFQLGRFTPEHAPALAILRESLQVAEAADHKYDVVRSAGALAERLLQAGFYAEGEYWASWALHRYEGALLADGQRHLRLLNTWAFARLVLGKTDHLHDTLWSAHANLDLVLPDLAVVFRSTLCELELLSGDLSQAQALAEANLWGCDRRLVGESSYYLVRVLLEQDKLDEALDVARNAVALTHDEDPLYGLPAQLALGMALTFVDAAAARPPFGSRDCREYLCRTPRPGRAVFVGHRHALTGLADRRGEPLENAVPQWLALVQRSVGTFCRGLGGRVPTPRHRWSSSCWAAARRVWTAWT